MPSSAMISKPAATQSSTVNRFAAAPARSMAIEAHDTSGGAAASTPAATEIDSGVTINFAYEWATEGRPGFSRPCSHVLLNSAQLKLLGPHSVWRQPCGSGRDRRSEEKCCGTGAE